MYVINFLEPGQSFDLSSIGGVSPVLQFERKNLLPCQLSRLEPEDDEMIKPRTFNIEAIGIYQNLLNFEDWYFRLKFQLNIFELCKKNLRGFVVSLEFFIAGAYRKHGIENPGHRPQTTCCAFCTLYRMLEKTSQSSFNESTRWYGRFSFFTYLIP